MKRKSLRSLPLLAGAVLLSLTMALLTACGSDPVQEPTQPPETLPTAPPSVAEETVPPETEPLPEAWVDCGQAIVHEFTRQELEQAVQMGESYLRELTSDAQITRLCFDPVLTHHDCVEACAAGENGDWTLEQYFAHRISLSYTVQAVDEEGSPSTQQGSLRLFRSGEAEPWQVGECVGLQCELSGRLRDGRELLVAFEDPLCGYEGPDGTLTAFCRRAGTDRLELQTAPLPWGVEQPPMDAEFYFAQTRPYNDGDLNHEPGWLGSVLSIRVGEDGMLGLYKNGELLWPYFPAACEYRLTENWIYYLDESSIRRMDYFGRENQLLYEGATLSTTFYVAQNTVFFIREWDDQSSVYRLYAKDGRCELLSAQIPVPLAEVGLDPPISNNEIVWSYVSPEFMALAEEKRAEYEAQYGELDNITYYGMLEQDTGVYSQISCYVNTLTGEYYELRSGWVFLQPERTEENIEKNGAAWWKDFQGGETPADRNGDLEDAPA